MKYNFCLFYITLEKLNFFMNFDNYKRKILLYEWKIIEWNEKKKKVHDYVNQRMLQWISKTHG